MPTARAAPWGPRWWPLGCSSGIPGPPSCTTSSRPGWVPRRSGSTGGRRARTGGITVVFDDWWFNVRPSDTEPLLRLNVEAKDPHVLEEMTARLLAVIRGGGE